MKLIVTGASGRLGRGVVEELLRHADPADLILTSRDPSTLAEQAAAGADVRRADFDDPESLAAAFSGGDRMLLISTDAFGHRIRQHTTAIDAAAAAGVGFVAYTSYVRADVAMPDGMPPEHTATEEHLHGSSLDWVVVRNSVYADHEVKTMAIADKTGKLVTNLGGGRIGYVAYTDCAASAAAALRGEGENGTTYDITGPASLSADDRAEIFSALLGKTIEVVQVDDEEFVAELEGLGMPEQGARMFASVNRILRDGPLDVVSTAVRDLTGQEARSLRDVLEAEVPAV